MGKKGLKYRAEVDDELVCAPAGLARVQNLVVILETLLKGQWVVVGWGGVTGTWCGVGCVE